LSQSITNLQSLGLYEALLDWFFSKFRITLPFTNQKGDFQTTLSEFTKPFWDCFRQLLQGQNVEQNTLRKISQLQHYIELLRTVLNLILSIDTYHKTPQFRYEKSLSL
jgi:hypothetical protein